MFIYKITNIINNKIYVGMTNEKDINTRLLKHIKRSKYNENRPLYTAFKKYGIENFKIEELEKCNSLKELSEKEIFWIKELNSLLPNGYNVSIGGEGGDTYTNNPNRENIIKKISQKLSGENNPFFGKKHSEESIEKMKKSHKGMLSGDKNGMFNKKHSKESIEKMKQNRSGGVQKGYCKVIYVLEAPTGEIININSYQNLMNFFDYNRLILKKGEYNGYKLIKKITRNKDGNFTEE